MSNLATKSSSMKKDKIVIYFLASNKKQDIEACNSLVSYLKPFLRNAKPAIQTLNDESSLLSDDGKTLAGEEGNKARERLYQADLVFALATKDFLDDDEIYERLKKVIERHNKKETKLVGILVRHCIWNFPLFDKVPKLPKDERPIYDDEREEDKAFTEVAKELIKEIMLYSVK